MSILIIIVCFFIALVYFSPNDTSHEEENHRRAQEEEQERLENEKLGFSEYDDPFSSDDRNEVFFEDYSNDIRGEDDKEH